MRTHRIYFVLISVIVFFCFSAPELATGSTPPAAGALAPVCKVMEWQPSNRRYARSLANPNVGEPRTVRLIYFLPNDRDFRPEVVQRMKDEIRRIQAFYREQMQAHGHGARTFQVETDAQGEPLVHRVDGKLQSRHYRPDLPENNLVTEIGQAFDINEYVYMIVFDNHREGFGGFPSVLGAATPISKKAGNAVVAGEFSFEVTAHELGHAFGLEHDFRDDAYMMSYGEGRDELSVCSAKFLAVHPYFNPEVPVDDVVYDHEIERLRNDENFSDEDLTDFLEASGASYPIVKLISPPQYPRGAESINGQIQVSDTEGIHQVLISVLTKKPHKSLFEKSFDSVSHQVNGSDVHHSLSSLRIAFIIQSQSTKPTKPRKCALNNPS